MAGRWRIKHKLIFGLGLVLVIMGLLLAGTLKGLTSYRTTTRSLDSKFAELKCAFELSAKIKLLGDPAETEHVENKELNTRIVNARNELTEYGARLENTISRGGDPDNGFEEKRLIAILEQGLTKLDQARKDFYKPRVDAGPQSQHMRLVDDAAVKALIAELMRDADQLTGTINRDAYKRINVAKSDYSVCLTLVLSTSFLAVVLMAGLLRFFYRWVFFPIRDLQQAVGRVAQGDFNHLIELKSGDEIEELANAFNDMTLRLHDMYKNLASQVNERSRQLVRSEQLASVGFLAAGVAHEINNPLASIAFFSEALQSRMGELARKLAPADVDTMTKYLRTIQDEAFRCKDITERLLAFSRGGERRREATDLGGLIQGVLDVVKHHDIAKRKHLVFEPAARVTAGVNAQEIKQVVLNLVFNALENMDEGGQLVVVLENYAGTARMRFEDTGCGMTQEVLDNIFEPFFTRSRTGKGTGLGLSISHRIIGQHGGEIEADSRGPGMGSTFTVVVPLHPVEEQTPEPLNLHRGRIAA